MNTFSSLEGAKRLSWLQEIAVAVVLPEREAQGSFGLIMCEFFQTSASADLGMFKLMLRPSCFLRTRHDRTHRSGSLAQAKCDKALFGLWLRVRRVHACPATRRFAHQNLGFGANFISDRFTETETNDSSIFVFGLEKTGN
jgi:hypothetical protein